MGELAVGRSDVPVDYVRLIFDDVALTKVLYGFALFLIQAFAVDY